MQVVWDYRLVGAESCRWFRITDYERHSGSDGLGLQIIRETIVQVVQNYRIIAVQE